MADKHYYWIKLREDFSKHKKAKRTKGVKELNERI